MSVVIAIAITAIMDFTGYFNFSALPLVAITLLFWFIYRLNKAEFGLKLGPLKYYGYALLYPLFVLGTTAIIAYIYGDYSIENVDWSKLALNISIGSIFGILMVLLTEEGFFRGWLWGSFKRSGMSSKGVLIITSILFTIWHISAVTSGTSYGLPLHQIPVYLVNAMLLGMIWGLLRLISGSVVVAAFCHAIWNPFAYELFGFGEKVGALGITNTAFFGPEVGYLGILLNGLFFLWLWNKAKFSEIKKITTNSI